MAKKWFPIVSIALLTLFILSGTSCTYNALVTSDENVSKAWANVENVYQRRMDLIPNLVATVKGAANFEQSTLTGVIEARAKATSVEINPGELNEENMQKFREAQGAVSSSLSRLMVVVERYPELKATQQFSDLAAQLEGTENRITVERRKYNEAATAHNTLVRKFPNNIIASMFGFERRPQFEAEAGAEKAPTVDFGTPTPAPAPTSAPAATPIPDPVAEPTPTTEPASEATSEAEPTM